MNISDMKKYFLNLCGAVFISLVSFFVFGISVSFEEISQLFSNQIIKNSLIFIPSLLIILILSKIYNDGVLYNSFEKISINSFISYSKKYVLLVLSLLIISILSVDIIGIILSKIITQNYGTKKLYDFVDLIGAITYTPFIEELVFRGLFFNLTFNLLDMENKVVKYIAITTNIMMFMSIHYVDYSLANYNILFSLLISVVPKLAISTSLVYVYFKTRDIKYNIILHMLYNFIIILISFIKQLY